MKLKVVLSVLVAVAASLAFAGRAYSTSTEIVSPLPQNATYQSGTVNLPARVRVSATGADQYAVKVVADALHARGVKIVRKAKGTPFVVSIGRATGLPAGGYTLSVKKGSITLNGEDADGQFYGAQTLRQLLAQPGAVPVQQLRDSPSFPWRGIVEGFYGPPWSQAERLSMLDFEAAHKMNLYMYGPKDDTYLRADWRTPFSSDYQAALSELVMRAHQDHVVLDLILSPGDGICYSSPDDQALLLAKMNAAWALGVRAFTLAFDDIDKSRVLCPTDDALGLPVAQATLANRVDEQFIASHRGPLPLIVVPTEYSGVVASSYKMTLGSALDKDIVVQWTGRYGISFVFPQGDAISAVASYDQHPVMVWDNSIVNDYSPEFLSLGALDRHDNTLPSTLSGVVADPMPQVEASRLELFTVADYAWNAQAYNPQQSWLASTSEFAGGDPDVTAALREFADVNWGSGLNPVQAPALSAEIDAFWKAWGSGDASAANTLASQLATLAVAPQVLRAHLNNPEFLTEVGPWLDATQEWAIAAQTALTSLVERSEGQPDTTISTLPALVEQATEASRFNVGVATAGGVFGGVLAKFITDTAVGGPQ